MLFVYLLENHATYGKRVVEIRRRMNERGDHLFTSALAAAEVMVGPTKTDDAQGLRKVEGFFRGSAITVLPFGLAAGKHYADIRTRQRIKAPDAVHLACAAEEGIDVFITNDKDLVGLKFPGIQFVVGIDTDLF
jgi:predicted nucleic acid-binding protein